MATDAIVNRLQVILSRRATQAPPTPTPGGLPHPLASAFRNFWDSRDEYVVPRAKPGARGAAHPRAAH